MSGQANYQAKVNFYHENIGTRNTGDVFQVSDSSLAQKLEQMGYIQKMDTQVHSEMMKAEQELQAKQQQYGQEQAQANEQVSLAAHEQNIQANKLTQEMAQARQQMTQQHESVMDKAIAADKAKEYIASATTNPEVKAQVAQAKAAKAKVADSYENK